MWWVGWDWSPGREPRNLARPAIRFLVVHDQVASVSVRCSVPHGRAPSIMPHDMFTMNGGIMNRLLLVAGLWILVGVSAGLAEGELPRIEKEATITPSSDATKGPSL